MTFAVTLAGSDGFAYNGNVVLNPGTYSLLGVLTGLSPFFPGCVRTANAQLDLISESAVDTMRTSVDEIDVGGTSFQRWNIEYEPPPFPHSTEVNGASQIWSPNHVRGNIRKEGTVNLVRYEPQQTRWYPA